MKEIIILFLFASLFYIIAILFIQYTKNCSTQESRKIVLDFLKECIPTPTPAPKIYFPVFIGLDENGVAHADIIEQEFHSLNEIFNHFYFHSYGYNNNRICFSFNVSNPLKEMTDFDLIQYCEKMCDSLVHRYMHKKNPSITHINNLVSIQYLENILTVYIATNYDGTIENSNQSLHTRSIYNQANISNNTTITESWSDK